jgi:hypothetical protein
MNCGGRVEERIHHEAGKVKDIGGHLYFRDAFETSVSKQLPPKNTGGIIMDIREFAKWYNKINKKHLLKQGQ